MGRRAWLENALTEEWIPRIKALTNTPEGRKEADRINQELQDWWVKRGFTTLSQQQSLLDITRRYIKTYAGENHFSLEHINFSTEQWTQLNNAKQESVAERNESVQFLEKPDSIVNTAVQLLEKPGWADIAAGLAVLTGRRSSELLSTAKFTKKSQWSVTFTGALKRRGELQELSFEIPTLTTADRVIAALQKLRHELPEATKLSAATVNERFGRAVQDSCDLNFANLVPKREGKDNLYTHLFRAVYATIATFWYCPPSVNETEFKAAIQGHYAVLDAENPRLQRSLAASRHYSDYEISDAVIDQYSGKRKGIKLGIGGIRPIEAFALAYEKRQQAEQPDQQIDSQPTPPEKSMKTTKMTRIRITEADRETLEDICGVLGFEGHQAEQMGQLVQWIQRILREGVPIEQSHADENVELVETAPEHSTSAEPQQQLDRPASSSLEQQLGTLVEVMQQFMALQIQQQQAQVTPNRNGDAPAAESSSRASRKAAHEQPSISATHDPQLTSIKSSGSATRRGASEQIINGAIDAIMAYNNQPDLRHEQKWAITINALKAFVKSQGVIERVLDRRADELQAHYESHQIDPIKHNHYHRGENILEYIQPESTKADA